MLSNDRSRAVLRTYPNWFYLPAAIVFGVFFIVPTALAFYFSLTRWTLFNATFIGLDNYVSFLGDAQAHGWAAQHAHLCRAHERTQSHHRAAARHAAHLEYPAQGAFSRHYLLPGARKYRRSWDHVLRAHAAVRGAHQHSPRILRAPTAAMAGEPGPRSLLGGVG